MAGTLPAKERYTQRNLPIYFTPRVDQGRILIQRYDCKNVGYSQQDMDIYQGYLIMIDL